MATRILLLVAVLATCAFAQAEFDMLFLKAYYLHNEEGKSEEARLLYKEYLEKAPAGRYAAQAQRGLQRIGATKATVSAKVLTMRRVKIPRDARIYSAARLKRLRNMEIAATVKGQFILASRLRSRRCYLSVIGQIVTGLAADDEQLTTLASQRDTHVAFNNEDRAKEVGKQIDALLLKKHARTLYSAVRTSMLAREKSDQTEPGSSFCIFLYDLHSGADLTWLEYLERFRAWLGDAAATPGAAESDVEAARAVGVDVGKAISLIRSGKREQAQAILDKIWHWSIER